MLYMIGLLAVAVLAVLQFLLKPGSNTLLTRLISGAILILLALLSIGSGGWVLLVTLLLLSLAGMLELFRATGIRTEGRPNLLEGFGYLACGVYYLCLWFLPSGASWVGIPLALILLLALYVFTYPRFAYAEIVPVFFVFFYLAVMMSCIYMVRQLEGGRWLVWLIFLSAWGCDTFAYCAGRFLGKHKMSPVLSPNKTIEGAVGGVAGAVVLGALYALITRASVPAYMLITLAGALVSMIGDLAASAIKRNMQIKDYGSLIPGHGGVLDRFDSILFTAPVVYLLAVLLL